MPIPRIACIVAATLGLHTATTSPNPPFVPVVTRKSNCSDWMEHYSQLLLPAKYSKSPIAEVLVLFIQLASSSIWAQQITQVLALDNLEQVGFTASPSLAFGSLLITCGALLRLRCYRALGKYFTFETGILPDHQLVTSGPYSWVRHPSYTGAFLAAAGLLIYYGSPGSFLMECVIKRSTAGKVFVTLYGLLICFVVTGLSLRIPKEDEGLRNEFGKEWDTWAAKVRYALIPGIY
ncbi:hypothetical protein C8J57DRAFT_1586638 [Mycena rebaudengoi]|nr:hypothetical protein C8J57DRAFT_1586638 [Mycena rebaudengoi]